MVERLALDGIQVPGRAGEGRRLQPLTPPPAHPAGADRAVRQPAAVRTERTEDVRTRRLVELRRRPSHEGFTLNVIIQPKETDRGRVKVEGRKRSPAARGNLRRRGAGAAGAGERWTHVADSTGVWTTWAAGQSRPGFRRRG